MALNSTEKEEGVASVLNAGAGMEWMGMAAACRPRHAMRRVRSAARQAPKTWPQLLHGYRENMAFIYVPV